MKNQKLQSIQQNSINRINDELAKANKVYNEFKLVEDYLSFQLAHSSKLPQQIINEILDGAKLVDNKGVQSEEVKNTLRSLDLSSSLALTPNNPDINNYILGTVRYGLGTAEFELINTTKIKNHQEIGKYFDYQDGSLNSYIPMESLSQKKVDAIMNEAASLGFSITFRNDHGDDNDTFKISDASGKTVYNHKESMGVHKAREDPIFENDLISCNTQKCRTP